MATLKELFGSLAGGKPFQPGTLGKKNLKTQINSMIANRPKYSIADEYSENQSLAKANLFAPDRAFQQRRSALDQEVADAGGMLGDVSTSSSGLLSSLRGIFNDKNKAARDLVGDEAAIRQQKLNTYLGTNIQMGEEKDKAYAENVKAPYNLKLNELVNRRKAKQENFWKILDSVIALGTGGMGGRSQSQPSAVASPFTPYPE